MVAENGSSHVLYNVQLVWDSWWVPPAPCFPHVDPTERKYLAGGDGQGRENSSITTQSLLDISQHIQR
jgi:hypothetical protein